MRTTTTTITTTIYDGRCISHTPGPIFPCSISPQLERCRCQEDRLWKHLAESFFRRRIVRHWHPLSRRVIELGKPPQVGVNTHRRIRMRLRRTYTWYIVPWFVAFHLFFFMLCFDYSFERSEFLIDTSQKKSLRVCSTNLGFSVVYVLCTTYVRTLYQHVCISYQSAPKIRIYRYMQGSGGAAYRRPRPPSYWRKNSSAMERT